MRWHTSRPVAAALAYVCNRAVPAYNALHCFWGPLALLIVAAVVLPLDYLVGALTWALHVALDRALGYGVRASDGFQRP